MSSRHSPRISPSVNPRNGVHGWDEACSANTTEDDWTAVALLLRNTIILLLCAIPLLISCSDATEVGPSDWKRYDWMRDVLGEQVAAERATHNLDTGEYRFVFTTPLRPDRAIAGFDQRAIQSGWRVQKDGRLSRTYRRQPGDSLGARGHDCISIRPHRGGEAFQFRYRPMPDC